jgi:hypothetical protein
MKPCLTSTAYFMHETLSHKYRLCMKPYLTSTAYFMKLYLTSTAYFMHETLSHKYRLFHETLSHKSTKNMKNMPSSIEHF